MKAIKKHENLEDESGSNPLTKAETSDETLAFDADASNKERHQEEQEPQAQLSCGIYRS